MEVGRLLYIKRADWCYNTKSQKLNDGTLFSLLVLLQFFAFLLKIHPACCPSLTEQALAAGSAEDRSVSSPSPCVGRTYHRGRTGPGGQSWLAVHRDKFSVGDREAKKRAQLATNAGKPLYTFMLQPAVASSNRFTIFTIMFTTRWCVIRQRTCAQLLVIRLRFKRLKRQVLSSYISQNNVNIPSTCILYPRSRSGNTAETS